MEENNTGVLTIAQKAEVVEGGIQVPVFNASIDEFLPEKRNIGRPLVKLLFPAEMLSSLLMVKVEANAAREVDPALLRKRTFPDGVKRELMFSSGSTFYFGNEALAAQIKQFFITERDGACRYGSLFTSDCYEGYSLETNLKVKVVDSRNPDDRKYYTGDCHGKVSPRLAYALTGSSFKAFQFRLAWMKEWSQGSDKAPDLSFLAKGTFIPDKTLTQRLKCDVILDRTSIKGVDKNRLDELLPCGDYLLPKLALGNRTNAQVLSYSGSWQFYCWYSPEAIASDIVPATEERAQELAAAHKDPLLLLQWVTERYEKSKKARRAQEAQELGITEAMLELIEGVLDDNPGIIEVIRSDKYAELATHPKVIDYLQNAVADEWRSLALRGAIDFKAGMAIPWPDLKRGTVHIPHLPPGDVIVTRYPIISKDNIRVYKNVKLPALKNIEGIVAINEADASEFHQADFDGDFLIAIEAAKMPHIAQETLRAGKPGQYIPVAQRPKLPYLKARDSKGNRRYSKLYQIAAASCQNKIGIVAVAIGKVQLAQPALGEDVSRFKQQQRRFLNRLMVCLQTEVDHQKNAERMEDLQIVNLPDGTKLAVNGTTLLNECSQWLEKHPCPILDHRKTKTTYRLHKMPEDGSSVGTLVAAVNRWWEPCRIKARDRGDFRHLIPEPDITDLDYLEQVVTYADELEQRYRAEIEALRLLYSDTEFRKQLSVLHRQLQEEIRGCAPQTQMHLMQQLWQSLHTPTDSNKVRRHCLEVAKRLKPAIERLDYALPHELVAVERYVLSVPFGKRALHWKEQLDDQGLKYSAIIHRTAPIVEFVFLEDPPRPILKKLKQLFPGPLNLWQVSDEMRIEPPADHRWALQPEPDSKGKAALVFNLFGDEIAQILAAREIEQVKLLGLQRNDLAGETFKGRKWKQLQQCRVGLLELEKPEPDHFDDPTTYQKALSEYYQYHQTPIVQLVETAKNDEPVYRAIGTFAAESTRLPVGSRFKARIEPPDQPRASSVVLQVEPGSVELPVLLDEAEQPAPTPLKTSKKQAAQLLRTEDDWVNYAQSRLIDFLKTLRQQGPQQHIMAAGDLVRVTVQYEDSQARVLTGTGRRGSSAQVIFHVDLEAGEVQIPLSANVAPIIEQLVSAVSAQTKPAKAAKAAKAKTSSAAALDRD